MTADDQEQAVGARLRQAATDDALIMAFVQGAKWWEFERSGATMWQSDQAKAEQAALTRLMAGTLGTPPPGTERAGD